MKRVRFLSSIILIAILCIIIAANIVPIVNAVDELVDMGVEVLDASSTLKNDEARTTKTNQPKDISTHFFNVEEDIDEQDWVVVEGVGITLDEAKRDAWRNAIEQTVGVLITSKSLIENGKLVEDVITSHSAAFVEQFKLLEQQNADGFVRVRIKAKVATQSIFEKIHTMGGKLEFRSVDGESKYAKIITQLQQGQSAIGMLSVAMKGYPEALINIEIGEERMVLDGVFDDGIEHLIIPLTFSWNNDAWDKFSNNLIEFLKHASSDSRTFRLNIPSLKRVKALHPLAGEVSEAFISRESSGFQVGWERNVLLNGEYPDIGRLNFDRKFKDMFDAGAVFKRVLETVDSYDNINDVVVILDKNLKNGRSYAVSRSIFYEIYKIYQQVPAFELEFTSKDSYLDSNGNLRGGLESLKQQKDFGVHMVESGSTKNRAGNGLYFSSIGHHHSRYYTWPAVELLDNFDNRYQDKVFKRRSPRYLILAPYFRAGINHHRFNNAAPFYISKLSYDYIVDINLNLLKRLSGVEINTYVVDLFHKRRRDNGSQFSASPWSLGNSKENR
jgi:hypothetical protein